MISFRKTLLSQVVGALSLLASAHAMNHPSTGPDIRAFAALEAAGGLAPGGGVPNFRLTDHRGVTRELYYEANAKVIVLVFTGAGQTRAVQTAATLRALRAKFSANDVVIWQIDANVAANRNLIVAEQTLVNNETPVLIDEAQLVATELGATRQLETFVIGPPPFANLIYRGPLDNADPTSLGAATENYVANAITETLASRTLATPRVELSAQAERLDLPPVPAANYATDVAPIVQRRCVSCHSAGNIAPHVYAKFADLEQRAFQIRADMLVKRMAPWHADAQFGVFSNDVALTPAESATLHAWARNGASRGTGPDPLATPPAATADWPLGKPDLILTLPKKEIPAKGTLSYEYPELEIPITEDKWIRATVVKPGNRSVVHHALVLEGSQIELLLNALRTGELPGLSGFFAGYVPGLAQTWLPEGVSKLIRKNSKLTVQMHYTTTGRAETDETQVGIYFAATPPARELFTKSVATTNIAIPAGAKEYAREATFVPSATRDVMLYELNPHMHYRGKRFRFDAVYPDGTSEVLLNVPQYDFAWQTGYRLEQPKRLPAGTIIKAYGAFDNSPQNPANPDPRVAVRFGEQTNDEMFIGYVNYTELPTRALTTPPTISENRTARAQVGDPLRLDFRATGTGVTYRASALPAGLQFASATGTLTGSPTTAGRHALVITAENSAGAAATQLDLFIMPRPGAPVFTQQPLSARARIGETVTLTAAVAAGTAPTYTWYFRGGEFCNTESPVLTLNKITAAYAGDYVCVAANAAGVARSAPATLTLEFSGLVNLSARANVGINANVVIPGITIRGTQPKTLLIRAAGPALTNFGITGALANPVVSIFTAAGDKILANDNWSEAPDVAALRSAAVKQGAFALPENGRDAAMLVTLPPGGYTVQVAGAGTGGAALGLAIVEVYEADAGASSLVNLSCRARVGTGEDILIAGFNISGADAKRVLIRAVGPTLAALGITGPLVDPKLELIRQGVPAASATVATNDNWTADLAPIFASVGAFALPLGSKDAALVVTLPPGSYTAQVSGVGTGTAAQGIAIVEVYELP